MTKSGGLIPTTLREGKQQQSCLWLSFGLQRSGEDTPQGQLSAQINLHHGIALYTSDIKRKSVQLLIRVRKVKVTQIAMVAAFTF